MKVLFVQPSHLTKDGKVFRSRKLPYPGLALPLIAALTPPSFDVEIVNDYAGEIDYDAPCDLVALTVMTPQADRAYQIGAEFKKRGRKVVMGGFHATNVPDETLQYCDAIVKGEAENVWGELLDDLKKGKLKKVYSSDEFADLSKLPVPRYDLLKREHFSLRALPVQTTRGCPMNCDFCSVTKFYGGTYRFRPVEDVVRDIKAANRKWVFFVDDNLAAKEEYLLELCRAIKPLNITWGGQCNLNIGKKPEVLKAAADAGCFGLFLGVESLSEESLKSVHKGFNKIEEYEECLLNIRRHGIEPMVSMIFGLDGDDSTIFERTYDFLIRNEIAIAYIFILTPGPNTRLFERLEKQNRLTSKRWSSYGGDEVVFQPKKLTPDELEAGFWGVMKRFYSWSNIFRRVLTHGIFNKKGVIMLKYNILHHKSLARGVHPLRG